MPMFRLIELFLVTSGGGRCRSALAVGGIGIHRSESLEPLFAGELTKEGHLNRVVDPVLGRLPLETKIPGPLEQLDAADSCAVQERDDIG